MKYYAKQVAPDFQENPFMVDSSVFTDNGIIISGNSGYRDYTTAAWERMREYIEEAVEEANALKDGTSIYEDITELVNNLLGWRAYTEQEIDQWRELLENWENMYETDANALAMSLFTGEKYEVKEIRGCCQSDWNYIYYPVDKWTDEAVEHIETEYFNTGSEWFVEEIGREDNEKISPEDMEDLGSIYCHGWSDEDIKKEIADCIGCNPEDVVLFKFAGYRQIATYEEA